MHLHMHAWCAGTLELWALQIARKATIRCWQIVSHFALSTDVVAEFQPVLQDHYLLPPDVTPLGEPLELLVVSERLGHFMALQRAVAVESPVPSLCQTRAHLVAVFLEAMNTDAETAEVETCAWASTCGMCMGLSAGPSRRSRLGLVCGS